MCTQLKREAYITSEELLSQTYIRCHRFSQNVLQSIRFENDDFISGT